MIQPSAPQKTLFFASIPKARRTPLCRIVGAPKLFLAREAMDKESLPHLTADSQSPAAKESSSIQADIVLTRDELVQLTGKRQPAAMASWLQRRNWIFEPGDRRGEPPKVARVFFNAKMTGAPLPSAQRARSGPRLDFFAGLPR